MNGINLSDQCIGKYSSPILEHLGYAGRPYAFVLSIYLANYNNKATEVTPNGGLVREFWLKSRLKMGFGGNKGKWKGQYTPYEYSPPPQPAASNPTTKVKTKTKISFAQRLEKSGKAAKSTAAKAAPAEKTEEKDREKAKGKGKESNQAKDRKPSTLELPQGSFAPTLSFVTGARLAFGSDGYLVGLMVVRYRSIINDASRPKLVQLDPLLMTLLDLSAMGVAALCACVDEDLRLTAGNYTNKTFSETAITAVKKLKIDGFISGLKSVFIQYLGERLTGDGKKLHRHKIPPRTAPAAIGGAEMPVDPAAVGRRFNLAGTCTN